MLVNGDPLNPTQRDAPSEPVLTGVSVIDALTALVRGQKLPVFSLPGLPHLRLACQIAAQAGAGGEPFSLVFAGIGLPTLTWPMPAMYLNHEPPQGSSSCC